MIRFENAFLQTKTYLFNLKQENKENAFRNEEMPVSRRLMSTNISSTSLPTQTPFVKSMKHWVDRKFKNLKDRITYAATYQGATETRATTQANPISPPLPPGAPTATAQTMTKTHGPASTQATGTQALNSEATQARAPQPSPVPTTAKLAPVPQFERFTIYGNKLYFKRII